MDKLLVVIPLMLVGFALGFLAINLSQRRRVSRLFRGRSMRTHHQQLKRRSLGRQPSATVSTPTLGFSGVTLPKSDEITHKLPEANFTSGEPDNIHISIGSVTGSPICPYCQQIISPTDDFVICPDPKCHTKHHKACWNLYTGCSMINCSQAPSKSL